MDGLPHYLICATLPFSTASRIELPIFRPNEYFFKNHMHEGEEKWQTYARVIRDLIAEHGNFELANLEIEDKFEYKKLLYPEKS